MVLVNSYPIIASTLSLVRILLGIFLENSEAINFLKK
jgi:hypothetical protein